MAQITNDKVLQNQIDAGTVGRQKGHQFEKILSDKINNYDFKSEEIDAAKKEIENNKHLFKGKPHVFVVAYVAKKLNLSFSSVKCWWTGGLATSGNGDILLDDNGNRVTHCKADIILDFETPNGLKRVGISVKSCNKKTPTNDQMFFSTARAFCRLLTDNGIALSEEAIKGMQMFCGDEGYRPMDIMNQSQLDTRISDPRRYFWEELSSTAKQEWKNIFDTWQDKITDLLFRKAYKNDPFVPEFLLHQTVKYDDFNKCEVALFTMEEIVKESREYCGYVLVPYVIRKGTYKNDNNTHYAPRFGFIQFQRGGQKQHPTQLQFNLKSGYFYHLGEKFSLDD